jgi:hypothetical protein
MRRLIIPVLAAALIVLACFLAIASNLKSLSIEVTELQAGRPWTEVKGKNGAVTKHLAITLRGQRYDGFYVPSNRINGKDTLVLVDGNGIVYATVWCGAGTASGPLRDACDDMVR